MIINNWLPESKIAAICFTIDDLHPASLSRDGYDAGGDLNNGVFGMVDELLRKHPKLKITLFTTADWREKSPVPTRLLLSKIPLIRNLFYLAPLVPKNHFRLDKYEKFVDYYSSHPQVEIAYHGLHHCHRGSKIPVEFQKQSFEKTNKIIFKMLSVFKMAGMCAVPGFTPPAWNAPKNLLRSLIRHQFRFIASARDIKTPITREATNSMSGYPDVSILYPEFIHQNQLIHFPSNFQATSSYDRAFQIIECNGMLSIKAHMIRSFYGHIALDGISKTYMDHLDDLLNQIEERYGDSVWWTSMGEISEHIIKSNKQ